MSEEQEDLVVYGGMVENNMIDLFCACKDGDNQFNSRVVMFALKMANLTAYGCLLDELEKRGYDASTMRFSISKKKS